MFSYSIPVCFVPDLLSKTRVDEDFVDAIKIFIDGVSSEFLLVILDQVDVPRSVFEALCLNRNFKLIFADQSIQDNCSTRLLHFNIPVASNDFKNTSLIYLGPHERVSTDFGSIFYHHPSLRFDSNHSSFCQSNSISRDLSKRNGIIDTISHLDNVGIIVENPNINIHVILAQYLQNICAANSIIADIIYVGRLNEIKLGNFADIEFFIHISCAGKPIFSFVKPIVSPFEFLCSKFDIEFWSHQSLRDFDILLKFCDENKNLFFPQSLVNDCGYENRVILKNFYELSSQILEARKRYSYSGLEICPMNHEIKLHKGAVGNSTSYDTETTK